MIHLIGHIALNIASMLYMVTYLPQLWHNHQQPHLDSMNFGFHAMLLLGTTMDLYNAFGIIAQWQYQAVGCMCLIYLLLQHLQWWSVAKKKQCLLLYHSTSWCVAIVLLGLCDTALLQSHTWCLSMAWLAQLAYICYSIPQIISNHFHPGSQALSMKFIYLAMATNLCDSIAAWALQWGTANCYGPIICFCFNLILWYQQQHHKTCPANQQQVLT